MTNRPEITIEPCTANTVWVIITDGPKNYVTNNGDNDKPSIEIEGNGCTVVVKP